MSWAANRRGLGPLILAACLMAGAVAASANVLVVRSSGPSARTYPPGRSLADNAPIPLRSGDTVVILAANGTRTFRGPGTFNPSAAVVSGPRIVQGNSGRAMTGGVRGGPTMASPGPAALWDVAQSGTVCIAAPVGVRLWRSGWRRSETLTIAAPDGRTQTLRWPAGASILDWPASVPAADGAVYELRRSRSPLPARIRLRRIDAQSQDVQTLAEGLIRNGCRAQLDLLVDTQPRL